MLSTGILPVNECPLGFKCEISDETIKYGRNKLQMREYLKESICQRDPLVGPARYYDTCKNDVKTYKWLCKGYSMCEILGESYDSDNSTTTRDIGINFLMDNRTLSNCTTNDCEYYLPHSFHMFSDNSKNYSSFTVTVSNSKKSLISKWIIFVILMLSV